MPAEPHDHPTSLPRGPIRECLERIQAEIIGEMNNAQHPANDGQAHIPPDKLQRWSLRLTEAIHFNGVVPPVDNTPRSWSKLDDGMRQLSYISTADNMAVAATHAKIAFTALGEFRHDLYKHLIKAADKLERYSDRMIITFDVDNAQAAVKEAYTILVHDILGLR